MIVQLLAGIVAFLGLFLLIRSLWIRTGLTKRQTWLTLGAAAIIIGLIALAAVGRLHWVVAAGAATLPFARRLVGLLRVVPLLNSLFPGWHQRFRQRASGASSGSAAGGQRTTAEAAYLRMSLDHKTGHMDGEIIRGSFKGRFLSELSRTELSRLAAEIDDFDSTRLLETYLDHAHPGWRETEEPNEHGTDQRQRPESGMSIKEALEVLGLDSAATRADVVAAHRRLIQKLHPDRGGSTYLAATLNKAKKVLLDNL